ncbi:hypothetical protein EV281_1168 [Rhizobium sp. BK418]|nr:hypothetical protein EV281_1168 [Rhizobium sp. BK418]
MIRFAPKAQQDTAPPIKIAKSNVDIRSDVELAETSIAAVKDGTNKVEMPSAAAPGPAAPAAKLLEFSGDLPPKGRRTSSRKRKEITSSKPLEISSLSHGQSAGELLLDL